jgi:alkylated DNA nucleotide flippase Atl1
VSLGPADRPEQKSDEYRAIQPLGQVYARGMATWIDLKHLIESKVPAGSVTTYGAVARILTAGMPMAVVAMLKKWDEEEPEASLSHRVVTQDGTCQLEAPQVEKLKKEGVRFNAAGKVNLKRHEVKLAG